MAMLRDGPSEGMPSVLRIALAPFILLLLLTPAVAQKRVALVIGNSAYQHAPTLANPKNDATDMAAALKRLGIQVIEGFDLDKASLERKVRDFSGVLRDAEVGLFYYAGHGLQVAGQNYLVPVDARAEAADALDWEMVRLELVQRTMERSTATNIIFLDACRNNPFTRNLARVMGTRSTEIGRGLAPVESGVGTLISFSTQPGNVALDGLGQRNSAFAASLVKHVTSSSDDLGAILIAVRNDVMRETQRKQVPWEHSALTGRFYFQSSTPVLLSSQPAEAERAWAQLKDTTSTAALTAFVARYGSTFHADLAKLRLARLELRPGREFHDCATTCPEMVVIPAGSFLMGSPESESNRSRDEGPQRKVTIVAPFAVGKYEVTFAEWDACVADNGCAHRPDDEGWGRGRRPVVNVSWDDANAYASWLSRKTGQQYRLLSEAEWEYVARAGTTTSYAFGNTITDSQARHHDSRTAEVGSYSANRFGIHDMHGNALEWVLDNLHADYKGAPSDGSVWQGGLVTMRTMRGGSWYVSSTVIRSATRFAGEPHQRSSFYGFRLARPL